jgi:hypothetical protein
MKTETIYWEKGNLENKSGLMRLQSLGLRPWLSRSHLLRTWLLPHLSIICFSCAHILHVGGKGMPDLLCCFLCIALDASCHEDFTNRSCYCKGYIYKDLLCLLWNAKCQMYVKPERRRQCHLYGRDSINSAWHNQLSKIAIKKELPGGVLEGWKTDRRCNQTHWPRLAIASWRMLPGCSGKGKEER